MRIAAGNAVVALHQQTNQPGRNNKQRCPIAGHQGNTLHDAEEVSSDESPFLLPAVSKSLLNLRSHLYLRHSGPPSHQHPPDSCADNEPTTLQQTDWVPVDPYNVNNEDARYSLGKEVGE
jgi:hypothetical protein